MFADVLKGLQSCPQEDTVSNETCKTSKHVDAMKCNICFDLYFKATTITPCLHTFCGPCLRSWSDSCKRLGTLETCPNCRTPVSEYRSEWEPVHTVLPLFFFFAFGQSAVKNVFCLRIVCSSMLLLSPLIVILKTTTKLNMTNALNCAKMNR